MKTTQEIAQTILDRRNRMNPVIMNGEMIASLGAEGMQEALQRRWLVPDTDTGHLQVSNDLAAVEELRTAAGTPALKQVESVVVDATHNIALSHAHRNIDELLAPGTGHDNSAPFRPRTPNSPVASPAAPAAPAAAAAPGAAPAAAGIGDEVLVAEGGKTYMGTIGAVGNDGKFKLTFGMEKPPMTRDYSPNEFKVTKKATP
jgi:hypothetical protein